MTDEIGLAVGKRLRRRRRLLGLTQQALAAQCGVTFQQIQKYECAVTRMSVEMLWKLACALEVEISYFFAGLQLPGAVAAEQRTIIPSQPLERQIAEHHTEERAAEETQPPLLARNQAA
jgi:transcriptional regulator with XRE-family HTH domain